MPLSVPADRLSSTGPTVRATSYLNSDPTFCRLIIAALQKVRTPPYLRRICLLTLNAKCVKTIVGLPFC